MVGPDVNKVHVVSGSLFLDVRIRSRNPRIQEQLALYTLAGEGGFGTPHLLSLYTTPVQDSLHYNKQTHTMNLIEPLGITSNRNQ